MSCSTRPCVRLIRSIPPCRIRLGAVSVRQDVTIHHSLDRRVRHLTRFPLDQGRRRAFLGRGCRRRWSRLIVCKLHAPSAGGFREFWRLPRREEECMTEGKIERLVEIVVVIEKTREILLDARNPIFADKERCSWYRFFERRDTWGIISEGMFVI